MTPPSNYPVKLGWRHRRTRWHPFKYSSLGPGAPFVWTSQGKPNEKGLILAVPMIKETCIYLTPPFDAPRFASTCLQLQADQDTSGTWDPGRCSQPKGPEAPKPRRPVQRAKAQPRAGYKFRKARRSPGLASSRRATRDSRLAARPTPCPKCTQKLTCPKGNLQQKHMPILVSKGGPGEHIRYSLAQRTQK